MENLENQKNLDFRTDEEIRESIRRNKYTNLDKREQEVFESDRDEDREDTKKLYPH